ncbi:MAG: ATP-binding cassette domain-containing protein [Lactobacillus delbrueckii]|jgi:ATPase subunit of ABC transporter with duplicated ATPase domains
MTAIQIKHLSYTYPSQAEAIFTDLSLDLDSSWKLALVGRNGRGKTTFLRLLAGQLGTQRAVKSPLTFTYYPRFLPKDEPAYFSLMDEAAFELWRLEKEMNRLNLSPDLLYQPFGQLSGGEQSKLLLALAFSQDGVFPLLDEPTNHLDGASRQEVADYLKKSNSGYIVVSHDRTFLAEVSDHVLDLNFKADYHQTLFTGRDLSLEIAGRTLFQGLDLAIASRGIVALTGPNGSGKSSFLAWLLGNKDFTCQGDWAKNQLPAPRFVKFPASFCQRA